MYIKKDFFITGKMGAGKDTLAQMLVPYGYVHLSIASTLKEVAAILYPEIMYFSSLEKRKLLQKLGDHLRSFDKMIFLRAIEYKIKKAWEEDKNVVISDVRLKIEYNFLKKLGFIPLKIVVDDDIRFQRLLKRDGFVPDREAQKHKTENELDDPDLYFEIIDNNGTFEDLKRRAKELVKFSANTLFM